jgi:pimeloyl-ACP methyl ester carboxylesterase
VTTTSAPTHLTEKITVTGLEMRYLKKGSGKPLVVLHHSISNHGWLPLYERLSRTFTVYVPDLPGFGESARPEWDSVRDEAIQVQFMLDRLGLDRVTLVGFGFGGFLAAEMATMNQHRLERLVLVGAAGIQPREGTGEIVDQLTIDYVDYVQLGFHDEDEFQKTFGEDPPVDTRMLLYGGREMTMRITFKPWMFSRALPLMLREVQTPALVVWGAHDHIIPLDTGKQFAEALPNAELQVIEDGGHLIDFEHPDRLAELIEAAS